MDNLSKILPIRNYRLSQPLVVAFNIHLTHHNAFGNSHYQRLYDVLTDEQFAGLQKNKVILLPNVTNLTSTIESRANSLTERLRRLQEQVGFKRCHLVTHSFLGVDARAALSMFGADEYVSSLTTVCAPHRGSSLIDHMLDTPTSDVKIRHVERIFEVLGITHEASKEFHTHNIANLNEVCEDSPSVDYFSIGAQKKGRIISYLLRDSADIIVNDQFGIQCDGVVTPEETKWGSHLMDFENDHLEVMGLIAEHNPANVMNLVADNTRLTEIRNDHQLKYDYGVDHL
jgi:hypothetical protein